MSVVGEFCGHALVRGSETALWLQLFEALRQEILRGRWAEGERIPSFKEILGKTGVGRNSLLRALDQLEAGGYVERVRHKGVFVKATATPGNRSLGTVVILAPPEVPTEPVHGKPSVSTQAFGMVATGSLIEAADKLGLQTQVLRGPKELPKDDVFGVISLIDDGGGIAGDRVVYLGTDDPRARPCLTGDPYLAAYEVTLALVRHGHRCIALFGSRSLREATEACVRSGIAAALSDAGLPGGEETLPEMREPDAAVPAGATAVLAFCLDGARHCVGGAESAGLRVPADLSVVSLQTGFESRADGRWIAGAVYPWDKIIGRCFDILLDPEQAAARSVARLTFEPGVYAGHTLAPPKECGNEMNPK